MRQLTSLDIQFLAVESPRVTGHVCALAVLDPSTAPGGALRIADVERVLEQRLHLLPPFRWRLAEVPLGLDHPYWIDDPDFDLDFHLREAGVPPPGGRDELADVVARVAARPLDRARPLWELYLLHGLEGGRVALLTKIHHAAVDGVSGAEVLGVLLDLQPEGREVPPPDGPPSVDRVPSQLELLGRGLARLPAQPLRILRGAPTALTQLPQLPGIGALPGAGALAKLSDGVQRIATRGEGDGRVLERPIERAPRLSFNARLSQHRAFAYGTLSLDAVKAIKNAAGVTVNDVVVTLVTAATRRWLQQRGELPDEPLVAFVPVSVRTEEQIGTFGNRISAMVVPIPTNEPAPQRRLALAHQMLAAAKDRHRATPASLLSDVTQIVPPAIAARAARVVTRMAADERTRPPLNMVISNVPGAPVPLYCAGARLEHLYPVSVIVDGVGLNVTVMSYLDRLDVGIVGDRELTPDLWPLIEALHDALAELESAATR